MEIVGAVRFQELLHRTAGLKVDKEDLRRLQELVSQKLNDLLVVASRNASANGRDVITETDLPLTLGLQESLRQFQVLGEEVELHPILEKLATYPPLPYPLSLELERLLPDLVGALILVVGQTIKAIDPEVVNPTTDHFERVTKILALTL
jgi:histone H3/H4